MKYNPGLLKLELFCQGIKIDGSCDLENDTRPVLRTRGGLGSGLDLILPPDLYVNVPLEERFVKKTPFLLFKNRYGYFIKKNGQRITEVILPPKPRFYDKKTSSGKLMSRIGIMQGTYLALYITQVCRFWQMQPRANCRFCSVGLNVGKNEELEKSIGDVLEVVKAAKKEEKITFVHFNTGFLFGKELDILIPYIKAVKEKTGLLIGVQSTPTDNLSKYDLLKKIGVDHLSFCLELFDEKKFKQICPGKSKYIGRKKYFEAINYCVKLFGKGKVAAEIIAGLEPPQNTVRAIEHFGKIGAVPTVCVFRPCLGTDLEKTPPPKPKEMLPVFRKLYQTCINNSIPVNMAPNIKVDLVILPEEAKYLLKNHDVKFFLLEAKMAIVRFLFRFYFRFRLFWFDNRSFLPFNRKID
ncbi:hypothetical protein GYA28_02310 [Candidatus Roizmanbacteria bacterium]|jgi:uncharacterized radical SAM superfamily protein|nr:hypothetical protein [Candidatus Roizmanbacteria bacterium]